MLILIFSLKTGAHTHKSSPLTLPEKDKKSSKVAIKILPIPQHVEVTGLYINSCDNCYFHPGILDAEIMSYSKHISKSSLKLRPGMLGKGSDI